MRESAKLLRRFEDHPLHAEIAARRTALARSTVQLVATAGRVESGIIDTLYLRGGGPTNGAWTIVEFKTDHVRDAGWIGCWRKKTTWPKRTLPRRLSKRCWG